MYETFEHTADLGLRIRAKDLDGLFEEAARAMFSNIVTELGSVRSAQRRTFEIDGGRHDDLLRDWLADLLYTFHAEHMLFSRFEVRIAADRLTAVARGEPIDPARHEIEAELKAVTYHGLKVEQEGDGWLAEVIIDL